MDPLFRVEVLKQSSNPQKIVWEASHQDYSESFVYDEESPSESKCGESVIKHLLKGDRGHYGPLEHPQIVFNCGWFPHSVMQQVRTHRTLSFDVQSFRYTGKEIAKLGSGLIPGWPTPRVTDEQIENLFYLRPLGEYTNRDGKRYEYTKEIKDKHLNFIRMAMRQYSDDYEYGMSEEHARGLLPFDYRQHFVFSGNMRSLMHLLDLRAKKDAQLECQWLCDLLMEKFLIWAPEIATWYKENRYGKARLSP